MTDRIMTEDVDPMAIAERIVQAFVRTGEAHADASYADSYGAEVVVRIGRRLSRGWQDMGTVTVTVTGDLEIEASRRRAWIARTAKEVAS